MQSMYDSYKTLRNSLRKINVYSALLAMWAYSAHIEYGKTLPPSLILPRPFNDLRGRVFLWQIHLMSREIILNCSIAGGEDFTARSMSQTLNHINAIGEQISRARYDDKGDADRVLRDLMALIHQQAPYSSTLDVSRILRYTRIFGDAAVGPILEKKLGLNIVECHFLILHVISTLQRTPWVSSSQKLDEFGIGIDRSKVFFNWLSRSLADTRASLSQNQAYDANWAYTWNALEERPLIFLNDSKRSEMLCPSPALLWQKIGAGLFFELVKEADFGNLYGSAFEEHVGEFAQRTLPPVRFAVQGETEYWIGKNRKAGLDWLIKDDTANIFIECKTKRLRQGAKLVDASSLLNKDLEVLATAIVQGYKNIDDVIRQRTAWLPSANPSFLAVTTLEDWLLFSPQIKMDLHVLVEDIFAREVLDRDLLNRIPYVVISCHEFERMIIAIKSAGIFAVLDGKNSPEFKDWQMNEFLQKNYKEEISRGFGEAYSANWRDLMTKLSRNWREDIRLKMESAVDNLP